MNNLIYVVVAFVAKNYIQDKIVMRSISRNKNVHKSIHSYFMIKKENELSNKCIKEYIQFSRNMK